MAVDTAGRLKSVEQNRPIAPAHMAVTTKMRYALITWSGLTPPNKKTRLKSGIDAAMNKHALTNPATSLPAISAKAESCEDKSRSKVCRSFSPLIAVEVNAGVINKIRVSCTNANSVKSCGPASVRGRGVPCGYPLNVFVLPMKSKPGSPITRR